MKRYTIFFDDDHASIGTFEGGQVVIRDIPREENSSLTTVAQAVSLSLKELGYSGEEVVLALGSMLLLSTSGSSAGLKRQTDEALQYLTEHFLPVEVEQRICDFVRHPDGAFFCVSGDLRQLGELVAALEAAGVIVGSISSSVLLATQEHCLTSGVAAPGELVLVGQGHVVDLIWLTDGKPAAWRVIDCNDAAILREIGIWRRTQSCSLENGDLSAASIGLSSETIDALRAKGIAVCSSAGAPSLAQNAVIFVQRDEKPWINLRRGALAPSDPLRRLRAPLQFAFAAAIAFLIVSAVALLYRTHQYDGILDREQRLQQACFTRACPSQSMPVEVTSRLRSEEKRLSALSGRSRQLPDRNANLLALYGVLNSLPVDMRYSILELRMEDDKLYIDGETRTHGDAEILAASLRRGSGFSIEPPRSEQKSDKVMTFTLVGSRTTPSATALTGALSP